MMIEKKQQSLSIDEQESITEAVLLLVATYPDFPKTVTENKIHLDDLKDSEDIGIFPTTGAVVTKEYVSGTFEAQFPFYLCYKCSPTSNEAVIAKRDVLDGLAKWLENTEYPALTDGRKIQNIKRTTSTVLAQKYDDGSAVFRCSCTLTYIKKKG